MELLVLGILAAYAVSVGVACVLIDVNTALDKDETFAMAWLWPVLLPFVLGFWLGEVLKRRLTRRRATKRLAEEPPPKEGVYR